MYEINGRSSLQKELNIYYFVRYTIETKVNECAETSLAAKLPIEKTHSSNPYVSIHSLQLTKLKELGPSCDA